MQAKGNMLELNAEEIPNLKPDVIIIGRAKSPDAIEKIYENPIYASTNAVKKSFRKSSWRL